MWRSEPVRSSSSCSERLRPTESGMKMRGKTTVDLSGSTGRREGTAPSTFSAGTSLTLGLSPLRLRPELSGGEGKPVHIGSWHDGVCPRGKSHLGLGTTRKLHGEHLAGRHRAHLLAAPWVAWHFFQVPDPATPDEEDLSAERVDKHPCLRCLLVVDERAPLRRICGRIWVGVRCVRNLASIGRQH